MPEIRLSLAEIALLSTSKDVDKTLANFATERGLQVVDFTKVPESHRALLTNALEQYRAAMKTPDVEDDKVAKQYLEQVINGILRYMGKKAREANEGEAPATTQ